MSNVGYRCCKVKYVHNYIQQVFETYSDVPSVYSFLPENVLKMSESRTIHARFPEDASSSKNRLNDNIKSLDLNK